jgi:hypothetical protein
MKSLFKSCFYISGTLLASITILFGCNTEYGEKHWFKAFIICFCSAILQIVTAIFVFGWVWSIMWGIVFIKSNKLLIIKISFSHSFNMI